MQYTQQITLFILCLLGNEANALKTSPQMGWNTWNAFGCNITESRILQQAALIKDLGLLEAGYEYLLIDDCWALKERDEETGRIVADPFKFPNGMLAVTRKVHALGLKVGIYSSAGTMTCGGYPGSLDNEELDAQTFAELEFDYLKYDNCFNQGRYGTPKLSFDRFNTMSLALKKTKRPFLYSLCNWGEDQPWNFAQTMAQSWRISGDITTSFDGSDDRCPCETADCWMPGFHCSILNILQKAAPVLQKNRAGGFADLDMLEVGNKGLSLTEQVSHFALWAILKSPLIIGIDLSVIPPSSLSLLKNKALIGVNQDLTSAQAVRVWTRNGVQLWRVDIEHGVVVCLLNTGKEAVTVHLDLGDVVEGDMGNGVDVEDMLPEYTKQVIKGRYSVNGTLQNVIVESQSLGVSCTRSPGFLF